MAQYVQNMWNTSPKTIKVFQNLSQLCSTYVHIFSNICSNSVHFMITISKNVCRHPTKSAKMWQSMFNICSNYVFVVSKLCWKFLPYMSKIRSKTVKHLFEICSKSAQNITNLSLIYVENMFKTVQNLFKKCNIWPNYV